MSDETTPAGQGPNPATTPATPADRLFSPQQPATGQDPAGGGSNLSLDAALAELARARSEAARYRTERNSFRQRVEQLEPLQDRVQELEDADKSEADRLRDKVAQLEAKAAQRAQEAAQAAKRSQLIMLAARAGVDPEVATLIDLDRLDLEDEEATLELLKKLAPQPQRPAGGGPSNPDTEGGGDQLTDEQLAQQYFRPAGSGVNLIFGG